MLETRRNGVSENPVLQRKLRSNRTAERGIDHEHIEGQVVRIRGSQSPHVIVLRATAIGCRRYASRCTIAGTQIQQFSSSFSRGVE
jgi:hypothetical protein